MLSINHHNSQYRSFWSSSIWVETSMMEESGGQRACPSQTESNCKCWGALVLEHMDYIHWCTYMHMYINVHKHVDGMWWACRWHVINMNGMFCQLNMPVGPFTLPSLFQHWNIQTSIETYDLMYSSSTSDIDCLWFLIKLRPLSGHYVQEWCQQSTFLPGLWTSSINQKFTNICSTVNPLSCFPCFYEK